MGLLVVVEDPHGLHRPILDILSSPHRRENIVHFNRWSRQTGLNPFDQRLFPLQPLDLPPTQPAQEYESQLRCRLPE